MTGLFFVMVPLVHALSPTPPIKPAIAAPPDITVLPSPPMPEEKTPDTPKPTEPTLDPPILIPPIGQPGGPGIVITAPPLPPTTIDVKPRIDQDSLLEVDQKPRALYQPGPTITAKMRRMKLSGTVVVLFVVDANGRTALHTVQSSPHPLLSQAALGAMKQWKFEPGRRKGQPTPYRMRQSIVFR